ncbi:MAG TPA: ROK family protein [Gammaproteobacteria bacterium]|nr:ROK family protein [Gammaproteobacteria bacterium]
MRIGIDLGGTKIEAIAFGDDGEVVFRDRVAAPQEDYSGTLQVIAELVVRLERELGRQGTVGIGMPGAISPATGLVKNSNSVCLNGQRFDRDLEQLLRRPLRIANDANCFALSEATDGAAAGAEVVFGVILGTGTGGGVAVRGAILAGANAIAGEWGHNPLPWPHPEELPGPPCYCGKNGCIETYLSGPGLARDFRAAGGRSISALEIGAQAERGDEYADAVLARYEDRLARGLASVINILDPDMIVVGGGLSNIKRLYTEVPRLWSQYVFSDRVATRLVQARFGDSSGVRGAAWLWPRGDLPLCS